MDMDLKCRSVTVAAFAVAVVVARAVSRPAGLLRETGSIPRRRQTPGREAARRRKVSPGRAPAIRYRRTLSWYLQWAIHQRNRGRWRFEYAGRPRSRYWSDRNPPSRYGAEALPPRHGWRLRRSGRNRDRDAGSRSRTCRG